MAWARPAEWITASTPRSAADMFCGRARSPTTAPVASGGNVGRAAQQNADAVAALRQLPQQMAADEARSRR